MGSRAGAAKSERTEADHQGGLCLAGSPFSRVTIIAPFLPSMRNCTIGLAFAQADRTYNGHPTRRKKPCPLLQARNLPRRMGLLSAVNPLLNPFGKDHSIRDDRIQSRGWPLASQIDSGVSKICSPLRII